MKTRAQMKENASDEARRPLRRHWSLAAALFAILGITAAPADPSDGLTPSEASDDLRRAVLRVIEKATTVIPADVVTPEMAEKVGPGAHMLIDVPGETTLKFCTANFVYDAGKQRYLGAAGHCFLPSAKTATHGLDADYDASSVRTYVCVEDCAFGGATGLAGGESGVSFFTGKLVELGAVAYARQADDAAHTHDLGNDFGIVAIPEALRIRKVVPVFGGPTGIDQPHQGDLLCHYGTSVIAGETFLTMGRVGIVGGSTAETFSFFGAVGPGDSGSPAVRCEQAGLDLDGFGAVGFVTHLWANDDEAPVTSGPNVGTTIARALEMAQRDAGLVLTLANAPRKSH
jgi:hypothetical protein